MTDGRGRYISDEQAAAIWQRAARLQMEAAQRLEERSRTLVARGEEARPGPGALRQEDVEAAAMEAGISLEYVQLAQAELGEAAGAGVALQGWEDRAASRLLGTRERGIHLSRVVAAPAAEVLAAMQRVLPAHPYHLTLRDTVGGAPPTGGALLFALPPYTTPNSPFAVNAGSVDLRQVLVRVMPGPREDVTEIVLRGDMHFGVHRNWRVGAALTGVTGMLGGAAGAAVGFKALAVAGGLAALPAAAGAVALGALGAWGYGAAFRYFLRRVTNDLEEMLQRVDVDARTGGGFAPPRPRDAGGPGGVFFASGAGA